MACCSMALVYLHIGVTSLYLRRVQNVLPLLDLHLPTSKRNFNDYLDSPNTYLKKFKWWTKAAYIMECEVKKLGTI